MFRSVGRLSLLGRLGGVGKGSLGFVAVPTPTRSIATSVWLAQRENRNEEIDEIFDDDIEGDRRPDHQARGGGGGGGDREFQEAPRRRYRTGINRVELLGGVGSTPIERVSRNGQPYATFTMYTNIDTVKKNGEVFQSTEMHGVMAFGNLARYVTNNVEKGTRVFVQGRIHYTGGVLMGDGARTPRAASISADYVLPIKSSTFQRNEDEVE